MQCPGILSPETKGKREWLSKTLCLLIGISKQCWWVVFFFSCHVVLQTSVCLPFSVTHSAFTVPIFPLLLETCISVPFSEVMTASQNSFHINIPYPSIKGLWGYFFHFHGPDGCNFLVLSSEWIHLIQKSLDQEQALKQISRLSPCDVCCLTSQCELRAHKWIPSKRSRC